MESEATGPARLATREHRPRRGPTRAPLALQRALLSLTEGLARDLAAIATQAIADEVARITEDAQRETLDAPDAIRVTHTFGWRHDPREPLLQTREVAARLGVPARRVAEWFRERAISRFAIGRTPRGYPVRLYRWADLASALDRDAPPRWVARDRTPRDAHVEPLDPERLQEAGWLRESLATLKPRTALLLIGLFVHEKTLDELGQEFSVSRGRVGQIGALGVRQLRLAYIGRLRLLWARDAPSVRRSLGPTFVAPKKPLVPAAIAPRPPERDDWALAFTLDDLITVRRTQPAFGTVVVSEPWPWTPRTPAEIVFERAEDVTDPRLLPVASWEDVRRIGTHGWPTNAHERIARINEAFEPRAATAEPAA